MDREKTHLHLKPRVTPDGEPDMVLRDPRSMMAIPAEGKLVANSRYWRKRLSDGDAILVSKSKAPSPDAKSEKSK